ncbi:hypothetical protein [Sulfurimonas sp.]
MSKHKAKIAKLFEHPLSSNIDYKKLINALEHFGAKVEMTKNHHAKIFFDEKEYVMPLPHKDTNISKEIVVELRHFLESIGLTPEKL